MWSLPPEGLQAFSDREVTLTQVRWSGSGVSLLPRVLSFPLGPSAESLAVSWGQICQGSSSLAGSDLQFFVLQFLLSFLTFNCVFFISQYVVTGMQFRNWQLPGGCIAYKRLGALFYGIWASGTTALVTLASSFVSVGLLHSWAWSFLFGPLALWYKGNAQREKATGKTPAQIAQSIYLNLQSGCLGVSLMPSDRSVCLIAYFWNVAQLV